MIVKKNTLAFWSGLEYRDPPSLNKVYLVPESSDKVYARDTPNSEYSVAELQDGRKVRVMASDVFTLKTEPKVHPSSLTCIWKIQIIKGDNRVVLVTWGSSTGSEFVANTGKSSFELTTIGRAFASTYMGVSPNDIFGWLPYFSEHQISCRVIYKGITYTVPEARNIKISRPLRDWWWKYLV